MTQQPEKAIANKNYATYIAGLFTEATPLNFPDNTVQFTQNFRYDPAGYIERRLGLEPRHCGVTLDPEEGCINTQSFRWRSVANRKDLDFIVIQQGTKLFLNLETDYDCYETKCTIDLVEHSVTGGAGQIAKDLVSLSYGNGSLFVTGKFIQPFRVDYTPDTTTTICDEQPEVGCKVVEFDICERDFEGIDDGIPNDKNPTELTDEHLYNLLNRGWTIEHIYQYFDEFSEYPSKAEYHQLGYTTNEDGNEEWSPKEVRESSTGSSSAPQGHFIRSIFNTCKHDCTKARGDDEEDPDEPIPTVDVVNIHLYGVYVGATTTIIKTQTPHGLEPGDILTLTGGNQIINKYCVGDHEGTDQWQDTGVQIIELDGVYTSYTIISPREVEITFSPMTIISNHDGGCFGGASSFKPGQIQVSDVLPEGLPCCIETYRPRANVFYAGRLWHMSMDSDRIGTNVYFSQLIRNHEDEGQAYQDQDPTARDYNELLKDDGGVISIPEMGRVLNSRVMKDTLLLFADNGIWSISGSQNGFFNATNYSVSKLTDVGCISRKSVEDIEDTIIYASSRGIYVVSSDHRVQSITEKQVHTKYYNIPLRNKENILIVYHKYDKTIRILYACDECHYRFNEELIFDTRSAAWYQYTYEQQIITDVFLTKNHHVRGRGLNYLVQKEVTESHYMTNCEYLDFTTDLASAYLHTAPETLGDLLYDKEVTKQIFYFDNIVESAARVNHVWDWRNVDEPCGKPGSVVTFDDPCLTVASDSSIENKDKGIALSMEMTTVEEKPLKIYGWSTKFESVGEYKPGRGDKISRRDRNLK